jgi:hypothetical protein
VIAWCWDPRDFASSKNKNNPLAKNYGRRVFYEAGKREGAEKLGNGGSQATCHPVRAHGEPSQMKEVLSQYCDSTLLIVGTEGAAAGGTGAGKTTALR